MAQLRTIEQAVAAGQNVPGLGRSEDQRIDASRGIEDVTLGGLKIRPFLNAEDVNVSDELGPSYAPVRRRLRLHLFAPP